MSEMPSAVSVIIPTYNEGASLRNTVDTILETVTASSEIFVVDDISTDGSANFLVGGYHGVHLVRPSERLGVVSSRNYGGGLAKNPFIVFADAHVAPSPGWVEQFTEALSGPEVAAVAPGISVMGRPGSPGYGHVWADQGLNWRWLPKKSDQPYEVPMLPGAFFGIRRDVFEITGGFDDGLLIWGSGDSELSLRLWLLGYRCLMVPNVDVAHQFKKAHNFSVNWELVLHNMLRTAVIHLNQERLTQVVAAMSSRKAFPQAFARLLLSDVWERRDQVRRERKRDDDWYFEHFGLQWPTGATT
jgi:GT2 family glycosyltransferase